MTDNPTPPPDKQPGNSPSQGDRLREYQWKPGQSGNPKGRPKRQSLEELVYGVLGEEARSSDGDLILNEDGDSITNMEQMARRFVTMAMTQKSGSMMKEILERDWPKVNKHAFTDTDGRDLEAASDAAWTEFASRITSIGARLDAISPPDGDGDEGDTVQ